MRVLFEQNYTIPSVDSLTTPVSSEDLEKYYTFKDALPDYFMDSADSSSLRFDLSYLDAGPLSIFKPSEDVKSSLIYPFIFSEALAGSTHFTERSGWPCYQLVYTYSGAAVLMAEGKTCSVRPGSFFLIDCMPEHAFYADSTSGWGYSFIHFAGPAMSYMYRAITANTCCFPNMEKSRAKDIYDRLFRLAEENPSDFDIYANLLLTQLMNELFLMSPSTNPIEMPDWLSKVRSYIVNNFNRDITLDELAAMCYLSRGRFSHKFTQAMGVSPVEYQYSLRISNACEYLRLTDLSVQEISERVGFHNVQNFQVKFKKAIGMSPTAFRKT